MPAPKELVGQQFGDLLVIDRAPNRVSAGGHQRRRWLCRCVCGTSLPVDGISLLGGHTKSCGCVKQRKHWNLKHGHSKGGASPTLICWRNMKNRAYNGAIVPHDPRWDVFENFLADMGECPPGMTLDREDFNGIYEKSNCRWATRLVQAANRRSTRWLTINGETKTVTAWAQEAGITYGALLYRMHRNWPAERLLEPMQVQVRPQHASAGAQRPGAVARGIVSALAADLPLDRQRRLATAIRQAIERASKEPAP